MCGPLTLLQAPTLYLYSLAVILESHAPMRLEGHVRQLGLSVNINPCGTGRLSGPMSIHT